MSLRAVIQKSVLLFWDVIVCRVAEKDSVNKMTLHNLATVYGPTLLRPAEDSSKSGIKGSDVMLLSALRMDVHYQVMLIYRSLVIRSFL